MYEYLARWNMNIGRVRVLRMYAYALRILRSKFSVTTQTKRAALIALGTFVAR